jgi:alpha-tubulin suppressor-like RCC1 family protein
VSVSHSLTCALLIGGAIRCFGDNLLGQLGSADRALSGKPPKDVPNVPLRAGKAASVKAGHRFACAILDDKAVSCWGEDGGSRREAELNARVDRAAIAQPKPPSPVVLPDRRRAVSLWIRGIETCVALDDGRLVCWGMPPDGICTFDTGRIARDLAWSKGATKPWIVLDNGRTLSPRSEELHCSRWK